MDHIAEFKRSVTVIDTETTHYLPSEAEIVEVAGFAWDGQWNLRDTFLMGARYGIPPEASSKNNISSRMIEGLPTFDQSVRRVKSALGWPDSEYFVAHYCKYDREVLTKAWQQVESPTDVDICLDNSRWLCTFRLAKAILDKDLELPEYNLSYLRYRLDLPVEDGSVAHRAEFDTLMCAKLLDMLVDYAVLTGKIDDQKAIGPQLSTLCWAPLTIRTFPLGKHRGVNISEIPTDYYSWAIGKMDIFKDGSPDYDPDLTETVRAELERRLTS